MLPAALIFQIIIIIIIIIQFFEQVCFLYQVVMRWF